jgi:AP-3 complex subunit delta
MPCCAVCAAHTPLTRCVRAQSQAVRKLTYLQMIGYDMSWAAFSVVEVMSSARFGHKRIGYLAANQTFTEETDVILLTTNHLKKEFNSSNQVGVGVRLRLHLRCHQRRKMCV